MIKPLGSKVLVVRLEGEDAVQGGIVIPQRAQKVSTQARVIQLGTGGQDKHGRPIEFVCKRGDRVILPPYGVEDVTIDGNKFAMVENDAIEAVVS